MVKNNTLKIISVIAITLSLLSLILFLVTPLLADIDNSENFIKIFFDGDVKIKSEWFPDVNYNDSAFPDATTILVLIGVIIILIGTIYMTILSFSGRNSCFITNKKIPGPITGVFFILGGLLEFIGLMIFVAYADEEWNIPYGLGFIFTLIISILALLAGIYLLALTIMNKDNKPRKSTKRKSRK